MYSASIKVPLSHQLSSGEELLIEFRCDVSPYDVSGEVLPVALFKDQEIIFPEEEQNQELYDYLLKVLGPGILKYLQEQALQIAHEKKYQF